MRKDLKKLHSEAECVSTRTQDQIKTNVKLLQLKDKTMSVIIGFVLERQPCLSEWQVVESFPVTPNDSDQEYALNITPKLY